MVKHSDQALDLTLVVDCFNIFICGISVSNGRATITQGLEQLTAVSAGCFYHAFHHLAVMEQTSRAFGDIHHHYHRVIHPQTDFTDLPFCHTMIMIDALIRREWSPHSIWHGDNRPPDHEYIPFVQEVAELAQAEYQRELYVPNWILNFAYNSLSLDPLPPVSILSDCLKIIAVNLGCDILDIATLDNRYVFLGPNSNHLLTNF